MLLGRSLRKFATVSLGAQVTEGQRNLVEKSCFVSQVRPESRWPARPHFRKLFQQGVALPNVTSTMGGGNIVSLPCTAARDRNDVVNGGRCDQSRIVLRIHEAAAQVTDAALVRKKVINHPRHFHGLHSSLGSEPGSITICERSSARSMAAHSASVIARTPLQNGQR